MQRTFGLLIPCLIGLFCDFSFSLNASLQTPTITKTPIQTLFTNDRNREKLATVVDNFISTPISSISQAQKNSKLGSFTMIQRYFEKLIQYGILDEITGGKRNRIYKATEILRILEE